MEEGWLTRSSVRSFKRVKENGRGDLGKGKKKSFSSETVVG